MSMRVADDHTTPGGGPGRPGTILHIGLPGTGTGHLQAAWNLRRDDLRRAGLHYAATGVTAHHHFDVAQAFLAARPIEPDQRRATLDALDAEMAAADRPVLVSSEHFSDATDADIRALAVFFGRGTRIVVTLREPIAWCSTMYAEAVRWGHRLTFEVFLEAFRERLDYEPLLRRWEAGFGRPAIRVVACAGDATVEDALLAEVLPSGGFEVAEGAAAALPAPLVHLQREMIADQLDGFALEPGLRRIWEIADRDGVRLPADWRVPDAFTKDFLVLDRANDRICRDHGLRFPLFGRTVASLLESNRQAGYGAGSVAEWLPGRPAGG